MWVLAWVVPLAATGTAHAQCWSFSLTESDLASLPPGPTPIVIEVTLGWTPNRGTEHTQCLVDIGPPWGDPKTTDGKVCSGAPADVFACCGPYERTNESSNPCSVVGRWCLQDRQSVWRRRRPVPVDDLGPRELVYGAFALQKAQESYEGGRSLPLSAVAPPASKCTLHWPVRLRGEIKVVLCFPYHGPESRREDITRLLHVLAESQIGTVAGSETPCDDLAAAIKNAWGTREASTYACAPPIAVGEIWGLKASGAVTPGARPAVPLTDPVTFELRARTMAREPWLELVGGQGFVTRGEAWLPGVLQDPGPQSIPLRFPAEGADRGKCTVTLPRGWRWTATARPDRPGFGEATGETQTPSVGVRLRSEAEAFVSFAVITRSGSKPEQCDVEFLKHDPDGEWVLQGRGATTTQANGDETWTFEGAVYEGEYRLRARCRETGTPAKWIEKRFRLAPSRWYPPTSATTVLDLAQ